MSEDPNIGAIIAKAGDYDVVARIDKATAAADLNAAETICSTLTTYLTSIDAR